MRSCACACGSRVFAFVRVRVRVRVRMRVRACLLEGQGVEGEADKGVAGVEGAVDVDSLWM